MKRYVTKCTISAAVKYGICEHVGTMEVANVVLWDLVFSAEKPRGIAPILRCAKGKSR